MSFDSFHRDRPHLSQYNTYNQSQYNQSHYNTYNQSPLVVFLRACCIALGLLRALTLCLG